MTGESKSGDGKQKVGNTPNEVLKDTGAGKVPNNPNSSDRGGQRESSTERSA